MAGWLRSKRERLRLSRRELLCRSRQPGPGSLTRTVIEDLEAGRRLPTLRRVPPLARALQLPGWVVAEHAWLAPVLEPPWQALLHLPQERLGEIAAGALPWHPARAAAAADLAARRFAEQPRTRDGARLLLAAACVRLDHPQLAVWQLERCRNAPARERALARAEAELALGRTASAAESLQVAEGGDAVSPSRGLDRLRESMLRAEVHLAEGRFRHAAERAIEIVDRHEGGAWLRLRALRCLALSMRGLGHEREARLWQSRARIVEAGSSAGDQDLPVDAARAHPR